MHVVNKDGEIEKISTPPADPIVQILKNALKLGYEPAIPQNFTYHYTTRDVYELLLKIYPNEIAFSMADVAQWLHELGFQFMDFGGLQFEWLLKKSE